MTPLPGTQRLLETVRRLRGPDGCPWDREQTLASLKPYLIEEAYELLDAIDSGDPDQHREELGDVLLQVALQAQIRAEQNAFDFDRVADGLASKLIRRHPHVFGETEARDSAEVLRNWDRMKAAESDKARARAISDGLPRGLPALQKAERIQARAARVGFDWPSVKGVLDKVREEIDEIEEADARGDKAGLREEIGDLLFALANLARHEGIHAEEALQDASAKFIRRFEAMESRIRATGRSLDDCTLEEMDAHWNAVKAHAQAPG